MIREKEHEIGADNWIYFKLYFNTLSALNESLSDESRSS